MKPHNKMKFRTLRSRTSKKKKTFSGTRRQEKSSTSLPNDTNIDMPSTPSASTVSEETIRTIDTINTTEAGIFSTVIITTPTTTTTTISTPPTPSAITPY